MNEPQPSQGAHLAFRSRGLVEAQVVRLPGSRIGLEVPTDLEAAGPVLLDDGRTVSVHAELALDAGGLRYRVTALSLSARPGEEINPDLLRQLRWAELFAVGVENVSRVVTFAEDGTQTRHRSDLTLTPDEQTAGLWLQARLAGVNPNMFIADRLGITSGAAAARTRRLRDAKILPASTQGQRR